METAPLKSFATWARVALIREVTARIAVVLAPASPERVEQPNAVAALEKAVAAAGGGEKGRAAVADKVAYTWFNRIIALRFLDANGYTGLRVVSPQVGVEGGQPEVLAEAKRGNIDADAVTNRRTVEAITGLLNGTRRSDDPQGEAYALLLAEYCRHWNRAMPFMFEREGDYTELLIPANLLADDSVLNRAVAVLTEDVCQDVEVIGWLYQFYISERKDEVFAGFKKNKKAGPAEIPAATQLFTPHWIVRYLVENSLGRLWLLNRPTSRLADLMDYYIAPIDEETDFLKIASPEEVKIIDPACGSGHMLTYAFDLLYAIYEEEGYAPADIPGLILTNNLFGTEIDPRAGALAAFALTMKARAHQRTFFTKQIIPSICVLEPIRFAPGELDVLVTHDGDRMAEQSFWNQFQHADTFGSLVQPVHEQGPIGRHLDDSGAGDDLFVRELRDRVRRVTNQVEYLTRRYSVVVTNPPYMGSGNMDASLSSWIKENYPNQKQDLYTCFVSRACLLVRENGLVAMVIGDTWMTIKAFEEFRNDLLRNRTLLNFVHLHDVSNHPDIFGANAAFVFSSRPPPRQTCLFVHLEPLSGEAKRTQLLEAIRNADCPWAYRVHPEQFSAVPGAPLIYQAIDKIAPAFESGSSLSSVAYTRIGLITGNNNSYIREWWEVSSSDIGKDLNRDEAAASGLRWFPISKGGEYRKWYGNVTSIVDWQRDGNQLQTRMDPTGSRVLAHNFNLDDIFREGVTWSKISSGRFSGRLHPAGYIFNDPSANIFPKDGSVSVLALLAYLSSNVADLLLQALSPTLNFQPGNVAILPWPAELPVAKVEELAREALSIARADWDDSEVSRDFALNCLVASRDPDRPLRSTLADVLRSFDGRARRLASIERETNAAFIDAMHLTAAVDSTVAIRDVTLSTNADWAFGNNTDGEVRQEMLSARLIAELVSYAVGCMFGRFSLNIPGPVLVNQGHTLQDYLASVPAPSFLPDRDNVIPIVDGDWFEDDIVARFRQFLRVAFGERHFEENLRFVADALGVKDLRDYFVKSFYKDHVQRYKKRPIYWLFSSPKGSFNALIYMHRYLPSTVSTVLNEYLREFKAKLESSLQHHERVAVGGGGARQEATALKEADRLRKVLLELDEYEHDVLYPLATQQVQIDLDDGVKVNYPKFGNALKKIPGLDSSDD